MMGNYAELQESLTTKSIKISKLRGTIYDCNMVPLTNTNPQKIAIVSPTKRCISAISNVLDDDSLDAALQNLNNNSPAICYINEEISCDGIATTITYNRDVKTPVACHLIGYTDDTGHGVTGLELAYDELLYSDKYLTALFACDGKGNVLKGVEPYFENDLSQVLSGVVTTIDINIQSIVEEQISVLKSGCAIVAEVANSKIRAMASMPTFDITNLAKSLNEENSPLLNRALCTFNVGSIFKPCVAIAAIESNYANISFDCKGYMEIGDRIFRCHNLSGHGEMNLCNALAQSCNCFFYNCAVTIGGEYIQKTASILNIGEKIKIADKIYAARGKLTDTNDLQNFGALANLSIGQGNLMASPISMLNLYIAIASNGSYYVPSVVEKTIKDGAVDEYDIGGVTKVMKPETAEILRQYLKTVITEGTGIDAALINTTAAGKTATAQTGRYYTDKTEITNSWFCGFFPADNPQYVIIVMSDSKSDVTTSSIFAKIANGIAEYKGINGQNND